MQTDPGEAQAPDEAWRQVSARYYDGEFVLGAENFVDVTFRLIDEASGEPI